MVYILVAKLGKLKLVHRAKTVIRFKITRDTLSISLMVAKTLGQTAAIHLTTFKNCTSPLKVNKTLQDVSTNVRALHCDILDRIRSLLNSVYVHYFEET